MIDEADDTSIAERIIRIIVLLRRQGASIRAIAKVFGESKSTMGRWVQAIEASQLGQGDEIISANSTATTAPSVPFGTEPPAGVPSRGQND
jgi:transposase-like protein